jgi:hypothetical protein
VSLYKVSARPPGNDVGEPTPLSTPEAIRSTARQILQRLVAQSNFLHGGNPGASTLAAAEPAAEEPSLKASALPLRKALVEKIQALRKDGQAVPEELPRWLAKLSEISPLWEGMTPAAETAAWKELRALGARHGLDLPATPEESEGEALFAAQPLTEEGRRREAGKLEKVRRTIEREAPEALTFWNKLLEQINVAPTSGIYQEILDAQTPARPIKGAEVAREARAAENFYTGQSQADFTALQKFYAKNIWRLKLLSEEDFNTIVASGEGLGTTIDLPGATGHEFNFDPAQKALVTQPVVHVINKLQEAKLTGGQLPDSYHLSELGIKEVDGSLPAVFDAYFGADKWILKSFDPGMAFAGHGNYPAPMIKNLFAAHAENRATPKDFAMKDALTAGFDDLMVQRGLDVDDHTDRSTWTGPVDGKEARVHVMTEGGKVRVVPYATWIKGEWVPAMVETERIKGFEAAARKAIEAVPEADRQGALFGPDVMELRDGSFAVVELNPTEYNPETGEQGLSGPAQDNPLVQDAIISALRGRLPAHARIARMLLAIKAAEESQAVQARQRESEGDALFAAAPDGEEAGNPSLGQRLKEKFAASREQREAENLLAASKDAGETRAGMIARQAGNSIRIDFGNPKELSDPDSRANRDLAAMPFVIEAGDKATLAADLEKVRAGKDLKLAKQYAPILQHGLDNFERLKDKRANYFKVSGQQRAEEVREKVSVAGINDHVGRMLHDPERAHDLHPLAAFGMSGGEGAQPRYVMRGIEYKKLVDAIADGHAPKTTNLADMTEHRALMGQRLIREAQFRREMAGMKAADGKPILGGIIETTERLNADGSKSAEQKLPPGYEPVRVGNDLLTIHKDFAPIFKALYGESAIRRNPVGNFFLKVAAFAKHNTLIFDSYHLFRIAAKANLGFQTGGHKKGLAGLNYAIEDLDRAVEAGHLSKEEAAYARKTHEVADKLLRGGLNVGRVADNLMEAAHAQGLFNKVPLVGPGIVRFNHWMFNQYQRGVVMQAGVIAYERNRARFPEMNEEEVIRRSASEVNRFFGNLGSQGFFKSKTMQDAARLVGFAPQWAESQFTSEAEGIAQMGKIPVDTLRGKGLRAGNVAQAMGGIILASLIGNQLLNLFTRGKPTWENEEEGRKWDAWIPGGANNRGFWFSPLSIGAEYSHAVLKYLEHGESAIDAATHVAGNKLSPGARGLKDLITGEDWAGRPFSSTGERFKMAAIDALPSPMPLGGFIEKDPKAPLGYGLNHQPGSLEKQGLSMIGLKVDAEPSARSKMYRIAEAFRANSAPGGAAHPPSPYSALRRMLDGGDMKRAAEEVKRLNAAGKGLDKIARALGIKENGTIRPVLFTGAVASEKKLIAKLSAEQRKMYVQAQKEHALMARKFLTVAGGLNRLKTAAVGVER